jgi:NitT/TauT family transport system ATP-binding protein
MKDNQLNSTLSLNNVSHNYGEVHVLNNLSLTVQPGEFVVLVGPSGCGKTTLLNLLSGYLKPSSGSVEREGTIRTVYQQDGLFPWLTVNENIGMGLRLTNGKLPDENEIRELIDLIHLQGFENHYPHQLSGGMRQRVELARVIAGHSDILLMDEPFSALDYQTRLRMRVELVRLLEKRPRTVVFVTHDIEEAVQLADRVLVLSNRPTSISKELHVKSAKPRNSTDDEVIEATKMILNEFGLQVNNRDKV